MEIQRAQKLSIRKNDQVQVISGREKRKTGKVLRVDAKAFRIFVEKVNMVKKHVRPNQKNPQGGVIEKEQSLHYSNVLLMCPKCNCGVRHGSKEVEAGTKGKKVRADGGAKSNLVKVRYCKSCGESLDLA